MTQQTMTVKRRTEEPGEITRTYTVWCGINCEEDTDYCSETMLRAAKEFRRIGWRKTKQYGWICGRCAAFLDRGEQP